MAIDIFDSSPIEIISVDSVMAYSDCNIGSAKPSKDILKKYPHHLVDFVKPDSIFTVSDFYRNSIKLIDSIHRRKKVPVFVGGTMMYFKSLLNGLDDLPERDDAIRKKYEKIKTQKGIKELHSMLLSKDEAYANQINELDEQRIIRALEVIDISGKPLSAQLGLKNKMFLSDKFNIHQYGILEDDRSLLHSRIEDRLNKIIDAGLVDEVNSLLKKYDIPENHPLRKSVNYKQAIARINNEYDDDEFFNRALFATRQLAKRQMTWLRSWKDIKKFKIDSREKIKEDVESLVSSL